MVITGSGVIRGGCRYTTERGAMKLLTRGAHDAEAQRLWAPGYVQLSAVQLSAVQLSAHLTCPEASRRQLPDTSLTWRPRP